MRKVFKKNRFRTRILLLFLLIVLLPMIALTAYLYNNIVYSTETRLSRELDSANNQWIAGYRTRKEQIISLADSISSNPVIRGYFTTRNNDDIQIIKNVLYSFRPMIDWMVNMNNSIDNIHFFTENEYVPEDRFVLHSHRYEQDQWFEDMCENAKHGRIMRIQMPQKFIYDRFAYYDPVIPYQFCVSSNPLTYMQLDFSAAKMYENISLVVDSNTGEVLFSTIGDEIVGEVLDLDTLHRGYEGLNSLNILDEKYYFRTCKDAGEDVLFVTVVVESAMLPELRLSQWSFLISCISLTTLMVCMAYLLTNQVVRRVERIGQMVAKMADGEYQVSYVSEYDDEIDRLGRDICEMGVKMDQLINQGLRQALLTKEAELRALQYQINPHFIFNTLESFQMLSELSGQKRLADMMGLLGKQMRYNLGQSPTITLDREIENVVDYIAVQNLNWNERIQLEMDIDKTLLDMECLRLMLQPIVENAIVHGMPPTGILHIWLSVRKAKNMVEICISNDGVPMKVEAQEHLRRLLEEAQNAFASVNSKNIALQNIQRRLTVSYGNDCFVEVEQDKTKGFVVRLRIPLRKES